MPGAPLRVVYTKSGKRDADVVVVHLLYWHEVRTEEEGLYLCGILNSEYMRSRVQHLQSRGVGGARHFDKVLFSLSFPLWRDLPRQRDVARLAATAEHVAASVPLEPASFTARRRAIRAALEADGVAQAVETAVERLLAE
ncbi:hypothetical protein C882_0666 [Caenispirillum salinarum AK4]|uniref:Uncharacterized protein n=1 Tax=Caenispirillum salinarum AK4 TaxID=1238182 RepID=K9HEH4_9PROT|nr:hypothetical protein [Caenispirillum salinarum]EKV28903.1 hypothetical protein C882_0666 [Caenispirillum salinarum AK4]